MSKFQFYKSNRDSQWYFRLRDNNNEIILKSTEGYTTKENCTSGISSVKYYSKMNSSYVSFQGSDLKYYFRIVAANGEKIGISQGYTTAWNRDRGIENCKSEAPDSPSEQITDPGS